MKKLRVNLISSNDEIRQIRFSNNFTTIIKKIVVCQGSCNCFTTFTTSLKDIAVSQLFLQSPDRLYTLLLLLLRVNTTAISQSTYYLHYLGTANTTLTEAPRRLLQVLTANGRWRWEKKDEWGRRDIDTYSDNVVFHFAVFSSIPKKQRKMTRATSVKLCNGSVFSSYKFYAYCTCNLRIVLTAYSVAHTRACLRPYLISPMLNYSILLLLSRIYTQDSQPPRVMLHIMIQAGSRCDKRRIVPKLSFTYYVYGRVSRATWNFAIY